MTNIIANVYGSPFPPCRKKKTLYDSLTVVVDKLSFNFKSRNSEIPN